MFSIFNGKVRGLGEQPKTKVHMRVSVKFREYLHYFKGAQLAVFIAIALHADDQGWSSPTIKQLKAETGYEPGTISAALTALCKVVIEGKRVLFAEQLRYKGQFVKNRYLIFPSAEEIAQHEENERKSRTRKPALGTVHGLPNTVESNTENRVDGINHKEEEPYMDNTDTSKDVSPAPVQNRPNPVENTQPDVKPPDLRVVSKEPLPSSDKVPPPTQPHMLPIEAWCKRLSSTLPKSFKMGAYARVSKTLHEGGVTAEAMDCAAGLFQAWIDGHRGAIAVNWEVGAMRSVIDASLSLCNMGVTAADMGAYVKEEKARDFWKGKSIPFDYVAKNVAVWKVDKSPSLPTGQVNMSEFIPDPDNPNIKITRAQLATRERNKKLIEAEYGKQSA